MISYSAKTIKVGGEIENYQGKPEIILKDLFQIEVGELKNIDKLTGMADYKIPQTLRKMRILEYSIELSEKVDNKVLIPAGSEEEIEIRANMVWAIELMKEEIKKKVPDIKAVDIDSYLWLLGQTKSPDDKPYHLTRTIFY